MTGPESESRASPGLETGCTANPTTATCGWPASRHRDCRARLRLIRQRAGRGIRCPSSPMTLRRATLYIGGGTLLVAWFSSAASMSLGRNPRRPVRPPIATRSRSSAERSRSACRRKRGGSRSGSRRPRAPQQPIRNPFAFGARPDVRSRHAGAHASAPEPEPAPLATAIVEPATGAGRPRRTSERRRPGAVRGDQQRRAGFDHGRGGHRPARARYTVTSIGNDAVEMKEASTGRSRRLVLQNP